MAEYGCVNQPEKNGLCLNRHWSLPARHFSNTKILENLTPT